jgi:hypothetical protein
LSQFAVQIETILDRRIALALARTRDNHAALSCPITAAWWLLGPEAKQEFQGAISPTRHSVNQRPGVRVLGVLIVVLELDRNPISSEPPIDIDVNELELNLEDSPISPVWMTI